MKKVTLFISIAFLLGGCASMSPIEKANKSESYFKDAVYKGKDFYISNQEISEEKYRIFHQASTGFSGTSGIRHAATLRAEEFCRDLDPSKKMITVSEHTASPPYVFGNFPRIEIIFACIDKEMKQRKLPEVAKYEKLKIIKSLLDDGTLTQEEFEIEKKQILNEI